MRKLLLGLTAAAALAFAVPGAAIAAHNGDRGGGSHSGGGPGGGHGGGGHGGSHMGSHMGSHNMGGHTSMPRGASRSFHSSRNFHTNRNAASRNAVTPQRLGRAGNFTQQKSYANSRSARTAWNHHHRHHRRHVRGGGFWWFPDYAYGDYAGYDTCYQYVWTQFGYRYVNTCGPDYYGAY